MAELNLMNIFLTTGNLFSQPKEQFYPLDIEDIPSWLNFDQGWKLLCQILGNGKDHLIEFLVLAREKVFQYRVF